MTHDTQQSVLLLILPYHIILLESQQSRPADQPDGVSDMTIISQRDQKLSDRRQHKFRFHITK